MVWTSLGRQWACLQDGGRTGAGRGQDGILIRCEMGWDGMGWDGILIRCELPQREGPALDLTCSRQVTGRSGQVTGRSASIPLPTPWSHAPVVDLAAAHAHSDTAICTACQLRHLPLPPPALLSSPKPTYTEIASRPTYVPTMEVLRNWVHTFPSLHSRFTWQGQQG